MTVHNLSNCGGILSQHESYRRQIQVLGTGERRRRLREVIQRSIMLDRFRCVWNWFLDWCSFQMGTVSIWLHPPQETPVDRAIREEGERLRKAFPTIDFDHPGSQRSRSV
jgi:hypothetical protein